MQLWNYKKLAAGLKDQGDKIPGFRIYAAFFAVEILFLLYQMSISLMGGKLIDGLLNIVVVGLGFWISSYQNKQGDNRFLLKRYISINFPITLQLLVLMTAIGLAITGVFHAMPVVAQYLGYPLDSPELDSFKRNVTMSLIVVPLYLVYFYIRRFYLAFRIASGQTPIVR